MIKPDLFSLHLYLDLLPEELVPVIETRKVLELTQQLYGRLRAITVQLGHVQVIHKNHQLLVSRSAYRERKGTNGKIVCFFSCLLLMSLM